MVDSSVIAIENSFPVTYPRREDTGRCQPYVVKGADGK
jgi:hypothetical protein